MCLLINKPANVDFNREWLRDFWQTNRDGVGVMWKDGDAVNVEKLTSPTVDEWIAFYDEFARGKKCVIHLRMRTHGDINEENTHPYYVGKGYFLMHNGVLARGNSADRSKSDTWHFIKDVLRPALRNDPKCFNKPKLLEGIGARIGAGNKMVLLGPDGVPKFINKSSGVMWKGAWFSNTYAWSAPRVGDSLCQSATSPVSRKFHFN